MERLYYSNKFLLLYFLLSSFLYAEVLRADNNLLQGQAISQLHPVGLSEKDVDLITSHPDVNGSSG